MQTEVLQNLVNYSDIYEYVSEGKKTTSQIKEYLMKKKNITEPTARRYLKTITGDKTGVFQVQAGMIQINQPVIEKVMQELVQDFGVGLNEVADAKLREMEAENKKLLSQVKQLEKKVTELEAKEAQYKEAQECEEELNMYRTQRYEEKKERIRELTSEKMQLVQELRKAELEQKVMFVGALEMVPKPEDDGLMLLDRSIVNLDIEKSICKFGGKRASFYEVVEDDPDHPQFDEKGQIPGHELNQENYMLRIARSVMPDLFFKSWAADNQVEKEFQRTHGVVMKESKAKQQARDKADQSKSEIQKHTEERLRKNKISIQTIVNDDRMTDQMKLQMYARFSDYHGTDMERLINYAAQYGVGAKWFIQVLEDADICDNYENIRDCLRMFLQQSDFHKKLELVQELLDGTWTVKVEYEGKPTAFAFVPVSEINEIRTCLKLPPSKFTNKDLYLFKEEDKKQSRKRQAPAKEKTVPKEVEVKPALVKAPDFVATYSFKEGEQDMDAEDFGLDEQAVDFEEYEEIE